MFQGIVFLNPGKDRRILLRPPRSSSFQGRTIIAPPPFPTPHQLEAFCRDGSCVATRGQIKVKLRLVVDDSGNRGKRSP
ncbi:hypothetical protein J6590_033454 [Homalodisca vitripennis]|nr:hypothetical protein J6590_033454 [Homalodisca vitripennis]